MTTPTTAGQTGQAGDQPEFDTAIRGYDRRQVNDRIQELSTELAKVKYALSQADRRGNQAEDELRAALGKLKESSSALRDRQNQEPQEGFGFRVEKMLRMAEAEASDVRSKAAREAAGLVEKARADAEAHRHSVEQGLIARAAELDQESARRQVEMKEREQQIADQLASARNEAEQLLDAAQRDAIELRKDAEAAADELRQRAAQGVRRQQETAEHELRRLVGLQDGVRGELARLHKLLTPELGRAAAPTAAPPAEEAQPSAGAKAS